ncbi:MAG: chemotaxis protein CheW [Sulfuritalea sp.]|jgi:purine-binding chemotaxis protein CheW|nr:chemotaxis protein CheW [Sulfuritalea sp.]
MGAMVKREGAALAEIARQEAQQYLTFMLGGEIFAVGILHIKEIIEYGEMTAVPTMPSFIRGVINLRGAVVPVIDLSSRFGGKAGEVTRRSCIVIVEVTHEAGNETEQQVMGIMVDAVNEVLEIPPEQIEPAPAFGARIRADFIAGMGKVDGHFVILLDANRVLSLDEIAQLTGTAHGVGGGAGPALGLPAPQAA